MHPIVFCFSAQCPKDISIRCDGKNRILQSCKDICVPYLASAFSGNIKVWQQMAVVACAEFLYCVLYGIRATAPHQNIIMNCLSGTQFSTVLDLYQYQIDTQIDRQILISTEKGCLSRVFSVKISAIFCWFTQKLRKRSTF